MANPDDRSFTYDEQVARKAALVADELVLGLRDGRAVIRANAALGLAALGHTGSDLVPFLRDSHPVAARAAAEAIGHLGKAQRGHLVAIAAALDGARPEVVELIVAMMATLVGHADAELLAVLDTTDAIAATAVIEACARIGVRGLQLLQAATKDGRARVRFNAVRGVSQLADLEPVPSIEAMRAVAYEDSVSDVRAAAMAAIARYIARTRSVAAARRRSGQPVPAVVPELTARALTTDELRKAAAVAPLDELLLALLDARVEVRLNAVRVLALQGPAAASAAAPLGVATRDLDATVRAESARAIGALGDAGVLAAPALVRALGDDDAAVIAAVEAVLAAQGPAATAALLDGLSVTREAHGARVAALLGQLPDGPALLRDALASTSVDVRVNAAIGLGALGPSRAAAAVPALYVATRGGNARSRGAVTRAIELLAPRPDRSPPPLAIDGFDARVLTEAELAKHKAAIAAVGIAGLVPRLGDASVATRANTALAFGVLGDSAEVRAAVAICLRDDAAEVRLGAARALVRLGDDAIAACATPLVRALGHADAPLAAQLTTMLRAATQPAIAAALAGGLDTEDDHRARQLLELITARPDAPEILGAAFARPGAQAHAARGFVALGAAHLGSGRAVLVRARTDSAARVRELARATLLAIDGVPAGPIAPAVPGFETEVLEHKAFAKIHVEAAALVPFLADARPAPRANAATGLGSLGTAAAPHALAVAALLRDDDDRVRVAAARALDQLGDDAVVAIAPMLVAALRGRAEVAAACHAALAGRAALVEAALLAGLETDDETHGLRITDLICTRPNARALLFAAFDGPAENVQINAAFGIAKLGLKVAGPEGRLRLLDGLPGPPTRRRYAMIKALRMLAAA
jgi:HEAT repeat protein